MRADSLEPWMTLDKHSNKQKLIATTLKKPTANYVIKELNFESKLNSNAVFLLVILTNAIGRVYFAIIITLVRYVAMAEILMPQHPSLAAAVFR